LPLLGLIYGVAWAVQGSAPFLASTACPEPTPTSAASPSGSPGDGAGGTGTAGGDDRLSLSFGFEPDPLRAGEAVRWSLSVTNVSDGVVTLTFASGEEGDVVLSQDGQERYQWSAGRSFTQAVRTVELAPGATHHVALDDTLAVEPGAYDLLATVVSEPSPAPAARTVTVDPGGGSGTSSPADEPSASPSASPSATTEPSATPSPSADPSDSASPTPESSPSSVPLIPFVGPSTDRRDRRRRRPRRHRLAFLLALALATVPISGVQAQDQDSGSGGKNVVLVVNQTDGRLAARANLVQGLASGPKAIPENLAAARASCMDCRTVAVAFQAVLVISDPDVASPRNAAVAANGGCVRCETFAYAWQYVVSTGGPVRVTPEGHQAIAALEARASDLAASDLPFPQLVEALDRVARDFRTVIDQEVERVGGRGNSERALDVEDAC
jgi:hypothetical protein